MHPSWVRTESCKPIPRGPAWLSSTSKSKLYTQNRLPKEVMYNLPSSWERTKPCRPPPAEIGGKWFEPTSQPKPNKLSYLSSKSTVSASSPKFFQCNDSYGVPTKPSTNKSSVWDEDFGPNSSGYNDKNSRISSETPIWFRIPNVGVVKRSSSSVEEKPRPNTPPIDGRVSANAPEWFRIRGVGLSHTKQHSDKPHRRPIKPPEQKNKYIEDPKVKILSKPRDTAINFQWNNDKYGVGFTRKNVDLKLPDSKLPRGKSLESRKPRQPFAKTAAELARRPQIEVSGGSRRRRIQDTKIQHNAFKRSNERKRVIHNLNTEKSIVRQETIDMLQNEIRRLKEATRVKPNEY